MATAAPAKTSAFMKALTPSPAPPAVVGSTLSWPLGRGPGLGEREVEVVQDVDVGRFERLTVKLLSAGIPPAR